MPLRRRRGEAETARANFASIRGLASSRAGKAAPIIVPGKPNDSLLIQTLKYDGPVKMPPKGKLPDEVIADFETWIKNGAVDPRSDTTPQVTRVRNASISTRPLLLGVSSSPSSRRCPRSRPATGRSTTSTASSSPACEAKGFRPAADAAREVLLRRLYFDLTGLPPSPEEVDAFVRDTDAAAYEKLRRSAPGVAAVRRALGPALARRGPLRRIGHAARLRLQGSVAVSRLRHRLLQPRRAVRPLRPRTARRRSAAGRRRRPTRRQLVATAFPDAGQHEPRRAGQEATRAWTWSTSSST